MTKVSCVLGVHARTVASSTKHELSSFAILTAAGRYLVFLSVKGAICPMWTYLKVKSLRRFTLYQYNGPDLAHLHYWRHHKGNTPDNDSDSQHAGLHTFQCGVLKPSG